MACQVEIGSSTSVTVKYPDDTTPPKHPLFSVELLASKDNRFSYSADLSTIPERMVKLFNRAIQCIQV